MPRFELGQLIRHRHYAYRGVVAGIDSECRAPDEWYLGNRTQPRRNQPWYHVLRDGGAEHYVAEESIELDASGEEVVHPYVRAIFPTFKNGRYYRESLN